MVERVEHPPTGIDYTVSGTSLIKMPDSVFTVAPDAVDMILQLRESEPGDDTYGLLIEVTGMRGAQFAYELSFAGLAAHQGPSHLVEYHGELPIVIRMADLPKLQGSTLKLTEQGLAMDNPNTPASPQISARPGNLTGPLAEQVATVLTEQVNPAIAMHGGGAELVSVEEGVAYLRLYGGCQGCGMAQVTLKQGIERILLEAIPELVAVMDVTDHGSGANPYYEAAKK
jgi:Fe/S biogenesis protein NfuA